MLTQLSLERFKSWKQIREMHFAPITGLFGPNSSGKTSILQLLLMLKQTAESPDRAQVLNFGDDYNPVSLGTFRDIIHQHEAPGTLQWVLSWTLSKELKVADPERRHATLFADKEIGFHAEVTEDSSGHIFVRKLSYCFAGYKFILAHKLGSEKKYQLSAEPKEFRFKRTPGRAWALPAPIKCYGFPGQVRAYYQNAGFLADFELAAEHHPDLLPEHRQRIVDTLYDPDLVRCDTQFGNVKLFSRWYADLRGGKHVVVVVISDSGVIGRRWIITAYIARKLAGGEVEWERS